MHRYEWLRRLLLNRQFALRRTPRSGGIRFEEAWPSIDRVEGWLVPGQERWLFDAAKSLADKANIVEIGSFKGRSTCSLALACVGTQRRVFAIDTFKGNQSDFVCGRHSVSWEGESFFDDFVENLEQSSVLDYVVPLIGTSSEVAGIWGAPIHLLFLDGSHQYEDVLADFKSFYPWVVSGGLIALHDVTPEWKGPYRVWHEHARLKLKHISSCSTISFGKKP
jgi:predicted O-methyltransferase YrrM